MSAFRTKQQQIEEMNYRIRELEEVICPTQQHDWVKVDTQFHYQNDYSTLGYQCSKCKKMKVTIGGGL